MNRYIDKYRKDKKAKNNKKNLVIFIYATVVNGSVTVIQL